MAPSTRTADEILDREFLDLRARLLEIAAALDRIGRGTGKAAPDPRLDQIAQALQVLPLETLPPEATSRAEAIQMIFSLPYHPGWRSEFDI